MKFLIIYLIFAGLFLTFIYGAGQCNERYDMMLRRAEAELENKKREEESYEEN